MAGIHNRYELLERLGVGGMAEVFRARMVGPAGFEKVVALKRILEDLCSDQDFLDRFIDEARLTARLQHPNICQVLDFGVIHDRYYLTLEYVRGLDLAKLLSRLEHRDELLAPELCLLVIAGVLRALSYAHRAGDEEGQRLGLVHRDVSPQNVLLSINGDIKLSDFGAAKANAAVRAARTQENIALGKLAYMAPEQRTGQEVDERTDVYGSAVLLAEMLQGPTAFRRATGLTGADTDRLAATAEGRFPPELAPRVAAIIAHAAARRPERRFADAHSMLYEIEQCARELGAPASTDQIGDLVRQLAKDDGQESSRSRPTPPALEAKSLAVDLSVVEREAALSQPNEGIATAPTELAPRASSPRPEELETQIITGQKKDAPEELETRIHRGQETPMEELETRVVSSSASHGGAIEELETQVHRGGSLQAPRPKPPPPPQAPPSQRDDAQEHIGPAPPASRTDQPADQPPWLRPEPTRDIDADDIDIIDEPESPVPAPVDDPAPAPIAPSPPAEPPAPARPASAETPQPAPAALPVQALGDASRKQVSDSSPTTGPRAPQPRPRAARVDLIIGALVLAVIGAALAAVFVPDWLDQRHERPWPPATTSPDDPASPAALIGASADASPPPPDVDAAPSRRPEASPSADRTTPPPQPTPVREQPSPPPRPTTTERQERPRTTKAPRRVRRSGPARLTIVATPPGRPYVDGRLVAPRTPVRGLEVTPGSHRVRVVFSSTGGASSSSVRVGAGEHQVIRLTP